MSYLIDTQVFLWWMDDKKKLSKESVSIIENSANPIFVSAAVSWEITIKKQLGKLTARDNIAEVMELENFIPLSITHEHAQAIGQLPDIHKDPFDRIQIAQAKVEGFIFVTRDKTVMKYKEIKTLKA